MNYADARDGLHIRFNHHDGTRQGGKAAPVFRLRPALAFVHNAEGVCTGTEEKGWDRVVVVPHPPYTRGHVLPFTTANADQFTVVSAPLKKVPAATKRQDRSGTRRR